MIVNKDQRGRKAVEYLIHFQVKYFQIKIKNNFMDKLLIPDCFNVGMEFFMGSLCDRRICSKGYRGKSTVTKGFSAESSASIVC